MGLEFKVEEQKGANFVCIPEDLYEAELVNIKLDKINTKNGETEVLRWTFKVNYENEYGEEEEVEVEGLTSTKLSTGNKPSKFYRWACVLLGKELKPGDKIDTDELIGKKCRVLIENRQLNDGTEISRVVDIKTLPKKVGKKKAKKAKKTSEDEEEEYEL